MPGPGQTAGLADLASGMNLCGDGQEERSDRRKDEQKTDRDPQQSELRVHVFLFYLE
jgi:hypothetical protein